MKSLGTLRDDEFISIMKEVGFIAPEKMRPLHFGVGRPYRTNGVDIEYLLNEDGSAYVNLFYSNECGQGFARWAMNAFLMETDFAGRDVVLHAMPLDDQTDGQRLVAFYQSFGFMLTGGQSRGYPELRRSAKEPIACMRQAWEASGLARHPYFIGKVQQALQQINTCADQDEEEEVERPRFFG